MNTQNQLSRKAIDDFKAAYKEGFGKILTDDEVIKIALNLLKFFGIAVKAKKERLSPENQQKQNEQ